MEIPPPTQPPQSPDESENAPRVPHLEWYRFALLLNGKPALAAEIFREAISAASGQISQFRSLQSRRAWLVRRIRNRSLAAASASAPPAPAQDAVPAGLAADAPWDKVAALPEPFRSVFALFHSLEVDSDELPDLLDMRPSSFAESLAKARLTLDPEQYFPVDSKLRLHRPWGGDSAKVAKAVRHVGKKAGAPLAAQAAFDNAWHGRVGAIALPSDLVLPELAEPPAPGLRSLVRQPAVLAIAFALLVVVGVLILAGLRKIDEFPGKEWVSGLVDGIDAGESLEEISATETGKLGDWFLLKGFDNFTVPPELENARAIACRVYKHDGRAVAQVALEQRGAMLFVFHQEDAKQALDSPYWHIYQQDDLAVAARGVGSDCFVVAFVGDADEMGEFLHQVGSR